MERRIGQASVSYAVEFMVRLHPDLSANGAPPEEASERYFAGHPEARARRVGVYGGVVPPVDRPVSLSANNIVDRVNLGFDRSHSNFFENRYQCFAKFG